MIHSLNRFNHCNNFVIIIIPLRLVTVSSVNNPEFLTLTAYNNLNLYVQKYL